MPFTLSHAAIALPFARGRLPVAALVFGTMSPDFPLYLPLGATYAETHSLGGALLLAVPLAAIFFLLWRAAVRPALGQLAPGWLACRLPAEWSVVGDRREARSAGDTAGSRSAGHASRLPSAVFALVAALVAGVLSHLLLDDLTHSGKWGADEIASVTSTWLVPVTPTDLQIGLSIVGLAVIVVWALLWLARAPAVVVDRRAGTVTRWLYGVSLLACAVFVAAAIVAAEGVPRSPFGWFQLTVELFLLAAAPAAGCTLLASAWVGVSGDRAVRLHPIRRR